MGGAGDSLRAGPPAAFCLGLRRYRARSRVAVGQLLETLSSPGFQERVYGIVKCGDLLWHLQNWKVIEILGTAYYHPVLPLIPQEGWLEHLMRWRGIARHLFWRDGFSGFWPPEMGFCMEMIPWLKRMGYRYVLRDSVDGSDRSSNR
jgi:hypothetical protein